MPRVWPHMAVLFIALLLLVFVPGFSIDLPGARSDFGS